MANKNKTTKKEELTPVIEEEVNLVEELPTKEEVKSVEKVKPVTKTNKKTVKKNEPKYKIGSIVYVSKETDADLNGFKLFPQYKKYNYTVEAYDEKSGVYTLRRLNLSLKLQEAFIVSPDERAHDTINRMQF